MGERAEKRSEDRGAEETPWWRPYPFEIAAVASALAAFLFLRLRGLRMDWRTVEYIFGPLGPFLPKALVAGVGARVVYVLLRRRSAVEYLRSVASPAWLFLWVRLMVASMVMTYGYFWIKVTIPLVNERLWDGVLWTLDAILHLGVSPTVFATELVAETPLLGWIDLWYGIWIPTVFYGIAFFVADERRLFRRRFVLSCVLLWTLGAWIYLSVPALGPIYVFPELWGEVAGRLPRAEGGQAVLWENYQRILAGRDGTLRAFNPTRGIAAMPSLHVGAHWLFALWARRRERILFVPLVVATGLTFLGSVVTGWHYAVDGWVGILLAWLCYRAAILLERDGGEEDGREDGQREEGEEAPEPWGAPGGPGQSSMGAATRGISGSSIRS